MRSHQHASAYRVAIFILTATVTCRIARAGDVKDGSSSTLSTVPSTCPYQSINYITQGLPRQCLTTSWTGRSVTSISGVTSFTTSDGLVPKSLDKPSAAGTTQIPYPSTSKSSASSVSHKPNQTERDETSISAEAETDSDSPLDNANFLSFEDWKHQNLAKAGQSAETFESRNDISNAEQRRRPGSLQNALDSLGEDSEIDIDFSGFVNAGQMGESLPSQVVQASESDGAKGPPTQADGKEGTGSHRRSKDAGKTCKERSNYASFDCASTVLKTNPECKGATSVLVENKDNYMLNVCSVQNKFIIVELCDDILIDTIVLANFEFFSSMFRSFRVSVSDRFPVKMDKWKELGVYEARNAREIQAFLVENPLIWARYLRIEFLTHYGKEYYCPISLLRVHGTTMMEEFNHEVQRRGEDDADLEVEEAVSVEAKEVNTAVSSNSNPSNSMSEISNSRTRPSASETTSSDTFPASTFSSKTAGPQSTTIIPAATSALSVTRVLPVVIFRSNASSEQCMPSEGPARVTDTSGGTQSPESSVTVSSDCVNAQPPSSSQMSAALEHARDVSVSRAAHPAQSMTTAIQNVEKASVSSSRAQASTVQPINPNPTTQESFFKSVHKRLQQLEANSTLSLQYIEEQSRILRDAFSKVEKRQLTKTSNFLETLNTTVLTELRDFRQQYDQIWQSTVLELSAQREQSQREMSALSKRLNYLADDVLFQKRVTSLQFMLILICLGFVMFPRHSNSTNYFEFPPLVQNALHRSSASLSRRVHLHTPSTSPPSTRQASRYGLFRSLTHGRSHSGEPDSRGTLKSPEVSPPTPESIRDESSGAEESRSPNDSSPVRRTVSRHQVRSGSPSPRRTGSNSRCTADDSDIEARPLHSLNEETLRPRTS